MQRKGKVLGHDAVLSLKPKQKLFLLIGSPETRGRERRNQDRNSHIKDEEVSIRKVGSKQGEDSVTKSRGRGSQEVGCAWLCPELPGAKTGNRN